MNYESNVCPSCAQAAAPIVYGLPTAEMLDLAKLDIIALGGCFVRDDNPTHYCYFCNETS